jgi:FkbM family methyltransferase
VLGRLARIPLKLVPDNRIVRVKSGINKGRLWITGSGTTHGCWIGNYEADHAIALPQLVKRGTVVYDVGCHAGYYTLALSQLVGDSGHVFAFEPSGRSVYFLRRHLELNMIRNVTVVQVAISDGSGIISFDGFHQTSARAYLVPSMSLDEFIASGNPPPAFLKMDIEGAEESALKGAAGLLSRGECTWMLATHSDALRIGCRELMQSYGYRFQGFQTVDPGLAHDFLVIPNGR